MYVYIYIHIDVSIDSIHLSFHHPFSPGCTTNICWSAAPDATSSSGRPTASETIAVCASPRMSWDPWEVGTSSDPFFFDILGMYLFGKCWHKTYGTSKRSTILKGSNSLWMVIFNGYVKLPEEIYIYIYTYILRLCTSM